MPEESLDAKLGAALQERDQALAGLQDAKAKLVAMTRLAAAVVLENGGMCLVGAVALSTVRESFSVHTEPDPTNPTRLLVRVSRGVAPKLAPAAPGCLQDPVVRLLKPTEGG